MNHHRRRNVLVLGAGGQLGRQLLKGRPRPDLAVGGLSHAELDIGNAKAVAAELAAGQWDLVINCASYTAVDKAESEPAESYGANVLGASSVAQACETAAVPLIHLSTEYVFDGRKGAAYVEDDEPNPLSVYGRDKAEAERRVRALATRHIILRTSWLFAAHGHNFVRSILRLAAERDQLRVVDDEFGCPTPVPDLAEVILAMAQALLGGKADGYGVFHYCGSGRVSRYGFAKKIIELAEPFMGRAPVVEPVPHTAFPLPAQRPADCVLDCAKLRDVYGLAQKPWENGLALVIEELLVKR